MKDDFIERMITERDQLLEKANALTVAINHFKPEPKPEIEVIPEPEPIKYLGIDELDPKDFHFQLPDSFLSTPQVLPGKVKRRHIIKNTADNAPEDLQDVIDLINQIFKVDIRTNAKDTFTVWARCIYCKHCKVSTRHKEDAVADSINKSVKTYEVSLVKYDTLVKNNLHFWEMAETFMERYRKRLKEQKSATNHV